MQRLVRRLLEIEKPITVTDFFQIFHCRSNEMLAQLSKSSEHRFVGGSGASEGVAMISTKVRSVDYILRNPEDPFSGLVILFDIELHVKPSPLLIRKKLSSFIELYNALLSEFTDAIVPDIPRQRPRPISIPRAHGEFLHEIQLGLDAWLRRICTIKALALSELVETFLSTSDTVEDSSEGKDVISRSVSTESLSESVLQSEPMKIVSKVGLKDFTLLKVIGRGSFGKVLLVRKKDDGLLYAMKVLSKLNVLKRNQLEHTKTERNVLEFIHHPFIVSLRFAFQTNANLYLVLDYCSGGELFFHLGRESKFTEERVRFYAAEIILALEHLHELGVVYRDLKPENVLLDSKGHVSLTDFGLSKEGINDNKSAHSFCGTPEYLAPEILQRSGHGQAADWWSLGALLFEMLTGIPPFYSRDRDRLFAKILKAKLRIPQFLSADASDLLEKLLTRDASTRLGSEKGAYEIKRHPWFRQVDWEAVLLKKVIPPFKPHSSEMESEANNFSNEFALLALDPESMRPEDMALLQHPMAADVAEFPGFSFAGPEDESFVSGLMHFPSLQEDLDDLDFDKDLLSQ